MPRELIFTSVPAGLKPGSTGYCTVARHEDMDPMLERELERLSFYEMSGGLRPVIHAYRILRLQTAVIDGDASTAMQQALHKDFHADLSPPGSSHVSMNTTGETTTLLRYVIPTVDEGLAEDLELMAKRRVEALLEEKQE